MDKKDELKNKIKYHKNEIEQLEEEFTEPGADIVNLNEQVELVRENIRNYVRELKSLGYDNIITELSEDLKSIGIEDVSKNTPNDKDISPEERKKELNEFFGKKLSRELKQYANKNKEEILKKSNDIAGKNKNKKGYISAIITAIAMIGFAAETIQIIRNTHKDPIEDQGYEDKNPIKENGHENIINNNLKKQFKEGENQEDKESDSHYIDKNLIYTSYLVSDNESGYIDLREDPSTKEIISQIPTGDTVYIKDNDTQVNKQGDQQLKQAIYYDESTEEFIFGYIDTELLEKDVGNNETILVKDKEIESDETPIYEYKPYEVNASSLNLRGEPSTETGEVLSKIKKGKTIYVNNDAELMNLENDHKWQKVMYFDSEKNEYVEGYADISWASEKQNKSDCEEVKFTDEDIEKIVNYKNSWENQNLYNYVKGYSTDYSNIWVNPYITEDGKFYICHTDASVNNGTKNYGFGIMVNQNGCVNNQVAEYFKEKGYNVEDPDYLILGQSKIPVEVVDYVSEEFVKNTIKTIEQCLQNKDVKFSKHEILALTGICYQFGRSEEFINNFIDLYIQYGNTEELRDNFVTSNGVYPLKKVLGGTDPNYGYNRGEANWKAFHYGDFIMAGGPTSIIRFDDEQEHDVEELEKQTSDVVTVQADVEEER